MTAGTYNSVLHVGDWAYNFEQDTGCGAVSCVGNNFMNLMQGYASIAPVMPAAGNHVSPVLLQETMNHHLVSFQYRLLSIYLYLSILTLSMPYYLSLFQHRRLAVAAQLPLSTQTPRETFPNTALDFTVFHSLQEQMPALTTTSTTPLTKESPTSLSFLRRRTSMLLIRLSYQIS